MLNQMLLVPVVALLSGCPQQEPSAARYVNTYLIPEGYHGWLVVREKPGGRPRPQEVTYQFDKQGFCVSDIKLGADFFFTHYFYVDASGQRREISSGDYSKKLQDSEIYAWSVGNTAEATADEYKGEVWRMCFIGTPSEREEARKNDMQFFEKYKLYKTVTVTRSGQ